MELPRIIYCRFMHLQDPTRGIEICISEKEYASSDVFLLTETQLSVIKKIEERLNEALREDKNGQSRRR